MRNNIGMRAVVLAAAMLLGACSAAEFWNGEYAGSAALRSSRNKEAAFYAAESPQAKATRAQNSRLCWSETNRTHAADAARWDAAYDRCMRQRGTPMWADDRGR